MQEVCTVELQRQGRSVTSSPNEGSYAEASIEKHRILKAEKIRQLQDIKKNLPGGKLSLDIGLLISEVSTLLGENPKDPGVIEYLEIEYYLNHPEIKNTNEFAEFIMKTRSSTYGF